MRYELVQPANLHSAWPDVLLGIDRIHEKSSERWLAEDVYCHIRTGAAQLFRCYDGDVYRGFILTETKRESFTNEATLHVWLIYGEPQYGNFADAAPFVTESVNFLDSVARANKATLMTFDGRFGWREMLKGWFKPVKVRYERRVT